MSEVTPNAPTPEQAAPAAAGAAPAEAPDLASGDLAPGAAAGAAQAEGAAAGAADQNVDLASADPAKPDPYAEFRGPPEGGAYGDFEVPDGSAANPALASQFTPVAAELGLSQAGAQRLVNLYGDIKQNEVRAWNEYLGGLRSQAQADPEIGGANYVPSVNAGRSVLAKFGDAAAIQALKDHGLAGHPAIIRMLSKIAKATGETPTLNGGSAGASAVPLHERMFK